MSGLKYSEILERNEKLGSELKGEPFNIRILSNAVLFQLGEILEYYLRSDGINASVSIGEYDNIVQESLAMEKEVLPLFFWEAFNIVDGFHFKAELMDDDSINSLKDELKRRIGTVFNALSDCPLILFNKFSSLPFNAAQTGESRFSRFCDEMNAFLKTACPPNAVLVDMDRIFAELSVAESTDRRNFYSSKSLYSLKFFKHYAGTVKPVIMSALGKARKALIMDCDNSLWSGILGEDGFDGIKMSSSDGGRGAVFEEIQHLVSALSGRGAIIGLCSKNNPDDVQTVIDTHPDMLLKDDDIVIKKVNWKDKPENLKEIARDLNIGLDSILFVDDSSFETELVKKTLPEVSVFRVPEDIYSYPYELGRKLNEFFAFGNTDEDLKRRQFYKTEVMRKNEKASFEEIDDYLRSLDLKMKIYIDDAKHISRASQLSKRTNQFNSTTKRYSEKEMEAFVAGESSELVIFELEDRFGSYGLSGLCILLYGPEEGKAALDSFLMSCRILGRKAEYAFMDFVMEHLREKGASELSAQYIKTAKNAQVENFFEGTGLKPSESRKDGKTYEIDIKNYKKSEQNFIEVNYV